MAHRIFDGKLLAAQKQEQALSSKIALCKKKMHSALLKDDQGRAREMQHAIRQLTDDHELALEKVAAVESTRPEADEEVREATNLLDAALVQVRTLNNSIPTGYQKFLQDLKEVLAFGKELMGQYQTLRDKHFEAGFCKELIGKEVNLPQLNQINTSELPELALKLKMLAQMPGFPNVGIKWQPKFAELRKQANRQAKLKRRAEEEAKGLNPAGAKVFTY